ncbi:Outer membrane protein Imp, required for envelope biogenesis / Organic solvent tolerance protein precursor [hydrothermal vent metagenome]|uniref:Outer membrane protein Imp, required for envelope biogenesis / Organic solvent tolerance protein n=1 Tax=hydrothermal vent metagenome TaxID=652676 RepID=A0A1W1EKT1_9ZZZZ
MKIFQDFNLLILNSLLLTNIYSSQIEINALDINSSKYSLEASKDVIAFANGSVINSINAIYDKNSTTIKLDGNISIIDYDSKNISANKIYLNSRDNNSTYKDVFISTKEDYWLYSERIDRDDRGYKLKKSIFSSCSIKNPDWIIGFNRAYYDVNSSSMDIYHAKIFVGSVPILYFPYLSISTENRRKSGLLFPTVNYNKNDGFLYEQPIYFAPFINWDLEINPQIRTNRSKGVYATLRFKDKPNSSGSLRVGYFKDNDKYIEANNLKNSEHYGLQFLYNSSGTTTFGFKDGLYANITLLNDIDYINLQKNLLNSLSNNSTYIRESRVNYFLYNDDYYMGLYGRYFIDTRKIDNDDTIQELPTIHLHKNIDNIIFDNLLYSIDLKSYNYYRKDGIRAKKLDFRVPLIYNKSFLNDYLNLEISQNIYASKVFFTGVDDYKLDNYKYYSTFSKFKISSDLTKIYDNYIHTIKPFIEYMKPNKKEESVIKYEELIDEAKELFIIDETNEYIAFGVNQYLYNRRGKLIFYNRLTSYQYQLDKLGNIRYEIGYNGDNLSLYNSLIYSKDEQEISRSLTTIRYRKPKYNLGLGYYYHNNFVSTKTKSINMDFEYDVNEYLDVYAGFNYDLEEGYNSQWRVGWDYDRGCWGIKGAIRQDIRPMLTNIGANSQKTTSITFEFHIVPFGKISSGG